MKQLLVDFINECIQAQTPLALQAGKLVVPLTARLQAKLQESFRGSPIRAIQPTADGFNLIISKKLPLIGAVDFTIKFREFAVRRAGRIATVRFRLDSYKFLKYALPLLTGKLERERLALNIVDNFWTIDVSEKVAGLFAKPWQDAEELKPFLEILFLCTGVAVTMQESSLIIKPQLKLTTSQKQIMLDFIESATT